jgi:hypothetical protein
LRDREAQSKGAQTGFVISMLRFGCCRWSMKYGPRDRRNTVVGARKTEHCAIAMQIARGHKKVS